MFQLQSWVDLLTIATKGLPIINKVSPSDYLVSYPGYMFGGSLTRLQRCSWCIPIYPTLRAGYDTRSIFKRSLTGLNSEFSFSWTSCLTEAEGFCLSYYLPIAGGRIIGFIPFPRVLVLCKMQLGWSRIWTRVSVSISYDDNDYTSVTSSCSWCMIQAQSTGLKLYLMVGSHLVITITPSSTLIQSACTC